MYNVEKFVVPGGQEPVQGIKIAGNIYHLNSNLDILNKVSESSSITNKVTIILTHPNGFVKEMWQPFIQRFLDHLEILKIKSQVSKIISIDIRNQGDSAAINESSLLEPPFKWKYNELDILAVIKNLNLEGEPLIGIGNSIGAVSLLTAEAHQPKTFQAIIAMDPAIFLPHKTFSPEIEESFKSSGKRRSVWPSREVARKHFQTRPFYQAWDPLVFEEYLEHGLRNKSLDSTEVTLKCSPLEEMKTFIDDYDFQLTIFETLAKVQCPTLFLSGDGPFGILNGEQLTAMVNQVPRAVYSVIPGSNHLLPFENPTDTAIESAKFIAHINSQEIYIDGQRKFKFSPKL